MLRILQFQCCYKINEGTTSMMRSLYLIYDTDGASQNEVYHFSPRNWDFKKSHLRNSQSLVKHPRHTITMHTYSWNRVQYILSTAAVGNVLQRTWHTRKCHIADRRYNAILAPNNSYCYILYNRNMKKRSQLETISYKLSLTSAWTLPIMPRDVMTNDTCISGLLWGECTKWQ